MAESEQNTNVLPPPPPSLTNTHKWILIAVILIISSIFTYIQLFNTQQRIVLPPSNTRHNKNQYLYEITPILHGKPGKGAVVNLNLTQMTHMTQIKTQDEIWKWKSTGAAYINHTIPWCAVNETHNITYLFLPKCGSSTIMYLMRFKHQNLVNCGDEKNTNINFKFTFIRNPSYRIISAYSTILSRGNILYFFKNGTAFHGVSTPENLNNVTVWRQHFNDHIKFLLNVLLLHYNDNNEDENMNMYYWNEHFVKMVDLMQGNNFDFIGCIYGHKELEYLTITHMQHIYEVTKFDSFNVTKESLKIMNVHEKKNIPANLNVSDYANIKYLSNENKKLIRQFYKEDFQLFRKICLNGINLESF